MASAIDPFSHRQLMLGDRFELHHYRDSYLSPVALHHHDFYELYFFLSGDVSYLIESRNYHLLPHDILLISPLELHQPIVAQEKQPYERIVLWISRDFVRALSTSRTDLARCFDIGAPGHVNLLRPEPMLSRAIADKLEALQRAGEEGAYGGDVLSAALITELLVTINEQALSSSRRYEAPDKSAAVVENALLYIHSHLGGEISLDRLAAACFVSKYHLSREFHRLVGTSVYRYVVQKRLIMAKQLLLSGQTPTEVCGCCGFGDYANFYRAFKLEYGISPKEFVHTARGR